MRKNGPAQIGENIHRNPKLSCYKEKLLKMGFNTNYFLFCDCQQKYHKTTQQNGKPEITKKERQLAYMFTYFIRIQNTVSFKQFFFLVHFVLSVSQKMVAFFISSVVQFELTYLFDIVILYKRLKR